jgi:hypothetical protein
VLNLLTISSNPRRMAAVSTLRLVAAFFGSLFKSRRQLVLENLALRQQVAMLRQSVKRPRATQADSRYAGNQHWLERASNSRRAAQARD